MMRSEPDSVGLEQILGRAGTRLTTGIALWEAARAVSRLIKQPEAVALEEVRRYCGLLDIQVTPIGAPEAHQAIFAHARYGKGNHPARLNMGDCFAYACARTNDARLLYTGDDFARTDLA